MTTSTTGIASALALCAIAAGCAAPVGEAEDYDGTAEALAKTNEDCEAPFPDGPPIDQTFSNKFPVNGFNTPSSYGSPECSLAYVVHLENAIGNIHSAGHTEFDFIEPKTMPTSQSECEKLRIGQYAWNIDQATPVYYSGEWSWGQWTNGSCHLSVISDFEPGSRYRIAVSLRRHSVAGDLNSSKALRPIRFKRYVAIEPH